MDETLTLRMAREAIHEGDTAAGQRLLLQVLDENPRSETAWLWLSAIVGDPARERDCLEQVLKINPNNERAKEHLAQLGPLPDAESVAAPSTAAPTLESTTLFAEQPAHGRPDLLFPEAELPAAEAAPPAVGTPAPAVPSFRVTSGFLSRTERAAILQEQIDPYVARGFAVQSRTATRAQLVRKKRFSVLAAILYALTVVGLIVYVIYFALRRNETVTIEIDPQGEALVTERPRRSWLRSLLLLVLVVASLLLLAILLNLSAEGQLPFG